MPAPSSPTHSTPLVHTGVSTRARAPSGVFETLADQHRQILELLRLAGGADEGRKRKERWVDARRRLLSHERAEAQAVYATLEAYAAAQTLLDQHTQQLTDLETAIQEVDAADPDSDQWIERLSDVIALVHDHVRDEESDFFPRAERLLGANTSRDLDERYLSMQRDILHDLE